MNVWVSPRSTKCNFWEPLQAKKDWKEKIRDLKHQSEQFWVAEKPTKKTTKGGKAPPL